MCEMAGRVNECILRWNQIQRNCYEALDRVVGAAVSNDVYYDRDEVGMESGYSENDSCPYHVINVKCVDKCGKPIFIKLMPAFGNTTNSGLVQSIQDVSFVTNANAIISATTDAPWKGVARYMGAPMASTPEGDIFCGGFNRHGALKIFGGDTDEDTLCQNQVVDLIGSVVPIILDGEITEQAKGMTTKQAICAIGYKSSNGDKVFFNCGKQDVQGMQGITVANILKGMGCTTAVITATAGGGMEYLGGLTSSPDNWQMPKNSAYWVVSKRPFEGWCNQFESSIAQLVQRVGGLKNEVDFINHEVDEVSEVANKAWELAQKNADDIAEIRADIERIDGEITALEERITTAENDIKALDAALKQEIQDRKDADAAEAQVRQEADEALGKRIDKEITDREAADEQLNTAIETEKAERTAADAVLQGNINQEAIDRANADLKIEQNLNKEIVNRTEADQLLQDQINGLTTGDVPLPYVKKAGDTMTGDLQMEGSAVVKLVDGKTVKGAFYRDNGDVCVKSESGNVRILGAATLLTTADNGAGQLKIGAITIQQHMSGDIPHLDINVGADAGAVYVNRNGIDGGTGELWVTEIHAPNELRLAPGTNVNAMDHRITGVADPIDDGDAVNKKYLDSHGPEYTLPVASATTLGGVKVGANLTITQDGVLNATGGGGGGTEYVAGEGIVISGNTISTDPSKIPTKEELGDYLPLAGGTMGGNIKFKGDAEYIGATVNDADHSIVIGSQGDGAIMGSVSAGHSAADVDTAMTANLNSKVARVKAERTTAGGSSVAIEAQDPDSENTVSVKVGAKAADVTGGTLSVYRDSNVDYVDVGANQLKFGDKGLIFGGGDGLRIISGNPSDGGSLFFNGTQKTAQFLTYKPQYSEAPTENHDLVNKEYVDGKAGGDYLPLSGGTMTGPINMGANKITMSGYIDGGSSGGKVSMAVKGGVQISNKTGVLAQFNQDEIELFGPLNVSHENIKNIGTIEGTVTVAGPMFVGGALNMQNHKIGNVADPTANGDAVNKKYVDDKAGNIVKEPGVSVAYSGFYACPGGGSVKITKITGTMYIYATCSIAGEQRSDVQVLTETIKANTNASTGSFRVSVDGSGNVSLDTVARNQPFAGFAIIWG
ncbi:MAG: phosphodiester glycosidase [Bacteriophage sp.]|nr:MAG: phosphodiester glycosidase [Bacteriophage sp.]